MNPSLLSVKRYFVTELSLTANRSFEVNDKIDARFKDIKIEPKLLVSKGDPRAWQVTMRIVYRPGPGINVPYHFTIEIVGLFEVQAKVPEEKISWYVETNATAVLYSTAREILRSVMSSGPYQALLLPTGSFYEPQKGKASEPKGATS